MNKPEHYFSFWETATQSWDEAWRAVGNIADAASAQQRSIVWRGMSDVTYPLHSSLYRRIRYLRPSAANERAVQLFEAAMLSRGRQKWRFEERPALELLANIQHFGGPTRLMDVTFTPLVALWFAVSQRFTQKGQIRPAVDGRLIAFEVSDRQLDLSSPWGDRELPWRRELSAVSLTTGPIVWRPPSYNERIAAQNAAFVVGAVPGSESLQKFLSVLPPEERTNWSPEDLRDVTSMALAPQRLTPSMEVARGSTFSIRIASRAKAQILEHLEGDYGYSTSTMYPDLQGLAAFAADGLT